MILTSLLWVLMAQAGQAQFSGQCSGDCMVAPPHDIYFTQKDMLPKLDRILPCAPNCKVEIKTNTQEEPAVGVNKCSTVDMQYIPDHWESGCVVSYITTTTNNICAGYDRMVSAKCVRITHELYIQGQRIGTIEERR